MASADRMSLREAIGRAAAALLIACTAFVSVGLTAPADGLVTIRVRPSVINLAVDVLVKVGPKHFHMRWSALPDAPRQGCRENT